MRKILFPGFLLVFGILLVLSPRWTGQAKAPTDLYLPLILNGSAGPILDGCPVFPADHIWNVPIDQLPVDQNSQAYIESIGVDAHLHPDFGSGLYDGEPIGIPYVSVPPGQKSVPVSFDYADESDPGTYPIPSDALVEGGPDSDGDRHILIVDQGTCKLYELFYAFPEADGSWSAASGAIFDLNSNALRPQTWTSADGAGLPILPGLVRYEEVKEWLRLRKEKYSIK